MPRPRVNLALKSGRDLYKTQAWLDRRSRQLQREPLCRLCLKDNVVTVATVADHIVPHKGDLCAFLYGELQSLCVQHHNSDKQYFEKCKHEKGYGEDGWPLDPRHPVYNFTGWRLPRT